MYGNSRLPASAQTDLHPQLALLVDRHRQAAFRKPCADYNRAAFATSFERFQRLAAGAPLILDACCGAGESSLALARTFPDHYVIGVDQSATRLARGQAAAADWPDNLDLVRADLVDYWRLLHDAGVRLDRHYLLYPNPWPKIGHLGRRWHGHPVFPTLIGLGGRLRMPQQLADLPARAVVRAAANDAEIGSLRSPSPGPADDRVRAQIPRFGPCAVSRCRRSDLSTTRGSHPPAAAGRDLCVSLASELSRSAEAS
jgi:tRNA (guanine-N7-)-methyltransferase